MNPSRRIRRHGGRLAASAIATSIVLSLGATSASAAPTPGQGATSSQTPYLTPLAPGVTVQSMMTVGDDPNGSSPTGGGYKMVGIPDGLGQLDNGDGTYTLLMNHELGSTSGVTRAHGAAGAFVSKWRVDKTTNNVQSGSDLITSIVNANTGAILADGPGGVVDYAISRLCSADLPPVSAFYNASSGKGTQTRIFMKGEETGAEGKAFGTLVTGASAGLSYYLPSLGRFSWENSVANPGSGDKTVVVGIDDSSPGQVYVYVGDKKTTGNEVDKAGLVGGLFYGVKVDGGAPQNEVSATGFGAASLPFSLVSLGDVTNTSGAQIQTDSVANGITNFLRPEDGVWDPTDSTKFYFVTTNSFGNPSRLWRLTFASATDPSLGGTIDMLLDGSEGHQMLDNMTADGLGHLILQEDIGAQAPSGKVWQYDIAGDTMKVLLEHDVARFAPPVSPFNNDEESSGVIPAFDILGPGWFLLNVEAHYPIAGELVQGGQMLAFYNPDSDNTPPPVVPEVPFAPILAVTALALLGGAVVVRRTSLAR